jgi:hypothetical protein
MILCTPTTRGLWFSHFLWDPETASAKSESGFQILKSSVLTQDGSLAYVEMRLLLTRLLWKFDVELLPESEDWYNQNIYLLWEKDGLQVKLTEVVREGK